MSSRLSIRRTVGYANRVWLRSCATLWPDRGACRLGHINVGLYGTQSGVPSNGRRHGVSDLVQPTAVDFLPSIDIRATGTCFTKLRAHVAYLITVTQ